MTTLAEALKEISDRADAYAIYSDERGLLSGDSRRLLAALKRAVEQRNINVSHQYTTYGVVNYEARGKMIDRCDAELLGLLKGEV